MENKFRPFRFARKRGIPVETVHKAIAQLGLPPTLSIKPEQREQFECHRPANTTIIRSSRIKSDLREISIEQAQQVISLLEQQGV